MQLAKLFFRIICLVLIGMHFTALITSNFKVFEELQSDKIEINFSDLNDSESELEDLEEIGFEEFNFSNNSYYSNLRLFKFLNKTSINHFQDDFSLINQPPSIPFSPPEFKI